MGKKQYILTNSDTATVVFVEGELLIWGVFVEGDHCSNNMSSKKLRNYSSFTLL